MKKITITLFLAGFILSGCDSEQSLPATSQTDINQAESIQADAVEVESTVTEQAVTSEISAPVEAEKPAQAIALSGEQVYKKSCINCHASGAANAPKLGDTAAWKARIEKGNEALYHSVKMGIPGTAMMAKGTCGACSDAELNAAVDYMVEQSQ